MIWWATQPGRAQEERLAVSELQERASWLKEVEWEVAPQLRLTVKCKISVSDTDHELVLAYPEYFPDVPAIIKPPKGIRLSAHQYGAGGELCLEYRSDNWRSDINGAMMLESAYRLLSEEQDEGILEVPSAHRVTLGQEVRGSNLRFLTTSSANASIVALPAGEPYPITLSEHKFGETWVACPTRIGCEESPNWTGKALLQVGQSEYSGYAVHLPEGITLPARVNADNLGELVSAEHLEKWVNNAGIGKPPYILLIDESSCRLVLVFDNEGNRIVCDYKTVEITDPQPRLSIEYEVLRDVRIGIVGCGSIGSKVAVSLARSGVLSFVLIDPDVFLPGNIVRNDLNLRSVGVSKAMALKQAIQEVNGSTDVSVRNLLLGGQESSESTTSAMAMLAECDVVVDASANPNVFNLCAAVCKSGKKVMVWSHVYAGGMGCVIARSRPVLDPTPQISRNQLRAWFDHRNVAYEGIELDGRYESQLDDGPPLIADDSEVSIAAAHTTRFVIDAVLKPQNSSFSCSAYVLGFKQGWMFGGPFETWPIEFSNEGDWDTPIEDNVAGNLKQLISDLFPKKEEISDES